MKKSKFLFSLAICGVILGAASSTALAAELEATTKGSIEWETPKGPGEVIKPDVPGVVIKPGEGGSSSGPLRLQHVPDFNFGKQEMAVGEQTFNPLLASYKFKEDDAQPGAVVGTDYYIPQFIQVTDLRGDNKGWDLQVVATPFTNGSNVMNNARIVLHETDQLSNTILSDTVIKDKMDVFTGDLTITTDATDKSLVMGTKSNDAEHSTNGTQTSLVLDADYNSASLDYKATDTNPGVSFVKPKEDVAVLGTYTSTITWNLTDGK